MNIFSTSFMIMVLSIYTQPIFIIIIIITINIVYFYLNREKFYFYPNTFKLDPTNFITNYNVEVGTFDEIEYWKIGTGKRILIFINGNAGNITYRQSIFENILNNMNVTLYSFDYLQMKNININDVVDLHINFIKHIISKNSIKLEDICIFGESIGNAIGLQVAERIGVKDFIFYCGFTSMADVLHNIIGNPFNKWINKKWFRYVIPEFNNYKILSKNKMRIIMLHGESDELIPYSDVEEMASKLNLHLIKLKGGHNTAEILEKHFDLIKTF